jgi:hypothetical protein
MLRILSRLLGQDIAERICAHGHLGAGTFVQQGLPAVPARRSCAKATGNHPTILDMAVDHARSYGRAAMGCTRGLPE